MSISQPISTLTINNEDIALAKSPYIGNDGYWYVFNEGSQKYVKSSSKAAIQGLQGYQGIGIKSDEDVTVISESGADHGKLQFTLYNPATTSTVVVKTNNSVQGPQGSGITSIAEITSGSDAGKLKITYGDPISGSSTIFLTSKIAAGFGTPTASVSTLSAGSNATVSVSSSGTNTEKVFSFDFGIPKGDKGDQGPQGNMITGASMSGNQIVFTLTDPVTSSSSTITASGEIPPITVNNVSADSSGNIAITGYDIPATDDDPVSLGVKLLNIENSYVSSINGITGDVTIPYATGSVSGLIKLGTGLGKDGDNFTYVIVDSGLNIHSANPVRNGTVARALDALASRPYVSSVNDNTGAVTIRGNNIAIDSSHTGKVADLVYVSSRAPISADATFTTGIWIDSTTQYAYFYDSTSGAWKTLKNTTGHWG